MSQHFMRHEEASLLAPEILGRLVGVIDLRDGQAVHAIAGMRESYQAVALPDDSVPAPNFPSDSRPRISGNRSSDNRISGNRFSGNTGNPLQLALGYHELGIRQLYIADLDAIEHGKVQSSVMLALFRGLHERGVKFSQWVIDLGWTGSLESITWFTAAPTDHVDASSILWVVPTESAISKDSLDAACQAVSPRQVALGLDYRQGRLISQITSEATWVRTAESLGLGGIVVIDLADVGTGSGGSSAMTCRRIRAAGASMPIFSGGGIRSAANTQELFAAGCDHCLVATALHGLIRENLRRTGS